MLPIGVEAAQGVGGEGTVCPAASLLTGLEQTPLTSQVFPSPAGASSSDQS